MDAAGKGFVNIAKLTEGVRVACIKFIDGCRIGIPFVLRHRPDFFSLTEAQLALRRGMVDHKGENEKKSSNGHVHHGGSVGRVLTVVLNDTDVPSFRVSPYHWSIDI